MWERAGESSFWGCCHEMLSSSIMIFFWCFKEGTGRIVLVYAKVKEKSVRQVQISESEKPIYFIGCQNNI